MLVAGFQLSQTGLSALIQSPVRPATPTRYSPGAQVTGVMAKLARPNPRDRGAQDRGEQRGRQDESK